MFFRSATFIRRLRRYAATESHMKTTKMLKIFERHTLEATLQVLRVAVSFCKGQKYLEIIVLHLKSTTSRPLIYDGAYPEKLWTAYSGNSMGVMKSSLLLLVVQAEKNL